MTPDAFVPVDEHLRMLERNEVLLHDINARIARLAIALGVSLHSEQEIAEAMHSLRAQSLVEVPLERRGTGGNHGAGPERRLANLREELRGLLVLRYGEQSRMVSELGASVTRDIIANAEAQLDRDGFAPGADGVDRTPYPDKG